jgi:hypothetical protein
MAEGARDSPTKRSRTNVLPDVTTRERSLSFDAFAPPESGATFGF